MPEPTISLTEYYKRLLKRLEWLNKYFPEYKYADKSYFKAAQDLANTLVNLEGYLSSVKSAVWNITNQRLSRLDVAQRKAEAVLRDEILDGCGLFQMRGERIAPTIEDIQGFLKDLSTEPFGPLGKNNAVILYNETFFYLDQSSRAATIRKIADFSEDLADQFTFISGFKLATDAELEVICSLTQLTLPELKATTCDDAKALFTWMYGDHMSEFCSVQSSSALVQKGLAAVTTIPESLRNYLNVPSIEDRQKARGAEIDRENALRRVHHKYDALYQRYQEMAQAEPTMLIVPWSTPVGSPVNVNPREESELDELRSCQSDDDGDELDRHVPYPQRIVDTKKAITSIKDSFLMMQALDSAVDPTALDVSLRDYYFTYTPNNKCVPPTLKSTSLAAIPPKQTWAEWGKSWFITKETMPVNDTVVGVDYRQCIKQDIEAVFQEAYYKIPPQWVAGKTQLEDWTVVWCESVVSALESSHAASRTALPSVSSSVAPISSPTSPPPPSQYEEAIARYNQMIQGLTAYIEAHPQIAVLDFIPVIQSFVNWALSKLHNTFVGEKFISDEWKVTHEVSELKKCLEPKVRQLKNDNTIEQQCQSIDKHLRETAQRVDQLVKSSLLSRRSMFSLSTEVLMPEGLKSYIPQNRL